MEFTYEIHDCTSIPLLKPDDELIGTLEDNQVWLIILIFNAVFEKGLFTSSYFGV